MNRFKNGAARPPLRVRANEDSPRYGADLNGENASEQARTYDCEIRREQMVWPDGSSEWVIRLPDGRGIREPDISLGYACAAYSAGGFASIEDAQAALPGVHRYKGLDDLGLVSMHFDPGEKKPAPPRRLTPEEIAAAEKVHKQLVGLRTEATREELAQISTTRSITLAALERAEMLGVLRFGEVCGQACWVLTDWSERCAEARRLDNQPFPAIAGPDGAERLGVRKAHTLAGSRKDWLVGLRVDRGPAFEILEASEMIFVAEGGPDYLALWDFVLERELDLTVLPVAILGRGVIDIHEAALELCKGKRVRIFAHVDRDRGGLEQARKWGRQFQKASCAAVEIAHLEFLRKADGSPVKDVNDLVALDPAQAPELEQLFSLEPQPRLEMLHTTTAGWTTGAKDYSRLFTDDFKKTSRAANEAAQEEQSETYQPKGNSPVGYVTQGLRPNDILVGDGLLERSGALMIAGPSGIGKSSIAMQLGCYWCCGATAFDLAPPRPLRVLMVQHEDSHNDLVRMSALVEASGLDRALIGRNFWIETVRGKIGRDAVAIMHDLVQWHRADLLILNPLSAFHDGNISDNADNVKFLYGELGALLDELKIGLCVLHHKGKPPRNGKKEQEDIYHEIQYEILGGSTLTNFFRGIITVSPIPNSEIYKFVVAKRFQYSGWISPIQHFKWDPDRSKRLWIHATIGEAETAKATSRKSLEDLRELVPIIGTIARERLENEAAEKGFLRRERDALLEEALSDTTPDASRLYKWLIYNPEGRAKVAYSRSEQPADETAEAVKEAKRQQKKR